MSDLALDPVTGDLALVEGRTRLTAPGAETVAQRLRCRLRLWQGEYLLDTRIGVHYVTMLGTKDVSRSGGPARLEAVLRQAASTCPGVASLDSFSFTLTADRVAIVSLAARAMDGTPIRLDDFVVSAAQVAA